MSENIVENNNLCEQVDLQPDTKVRRFDITSKDTAFAVGFLIASIIMSAFGICGGLRAGFSVLVVILSSVMTAYLKTNDIKLSVYPVISLILSFGLAVNFAVTSNSSVRFWSFVLLGLLQLIWFTSLVNKTSAGGDLGIVKEIFTPIFLSVLPNLPNSVISLFSGDKKHNKVIGRILLGVIPAVPVLFVIVPLLMSSDAAFSGMMELAFENTALLILKILLGFIISVFIIGYCFSIKKKELPEIKCCGFNGIESTVIISFLSVLSVCYVSYLFSQLAYFFSAFSGFLPKDYKFSVSTYARRGFFEMSIIATINFIIIFAALILSRKKNGKINLLSRIICTFIGVFTLIIISTALSKMFLYINCYGMTELRITTSVFMIFLAVVFITLMVRLYVPAVKVIKTGFIAAAVALILLGTINVNSVIASYNYNAYQKKVLKDIDVSTIYELGDEGIPYLVKLTKDKNSEVSELAKLKLSYSYEDYYEIEYNSDKKRFEVGEKYYANAEQLSISRSKAYEALEFFLSKNPDILEFKKDYYEKTEVW